MCKGRGREEMFVCEGRGREEMFSRGVKERERGGVWCVNRRREREGGGECVFVCVMCGYLCVKEGNFCLKGSCV